MNEHFRFNFNVIRGMNFLWFILGAVCFAIVFSVINKQYPTALDVYRGNTELQITSINGVPNDTVIVFKNK